MYDVIVILIIIHIMISCSLTRMSYTSLVAVLTIESLSEGQTWEACPLGQGTIDIFAPKLSTKHLQPTIHQQDAVTESDHVS